MDDLTLLWILVVLSFAAAGLRVQLAKKQGHPYGPLWTLQGLVFPVLLLLALGLYVTGTADLVFQLVMVGLAEELVCLPIRRKSQNRTK
jgi:hypothetical protein